jgi:hypothetical protein
VKLKKIIALILLSFASLSPLAFAADTPQSLGKVDEQRLIGRWVRPDGGYVIDIRAVKAGGNLDAAYFNPNPIHVSRAEWLKENGILSIFIELNDQNYPGATYRLRYYPESEQLAGEYTQPLVQQTFDIYFVRETNSAGNGVS